MDQETYDIIDKYLKGHMSEQEAGDFEIKISKDDSLREIVETEREIIKGIRRSAKIDFQKSLDEIHAKMDHQEDVSHPVAVKKPFPWWWWLGGIALIGLATYFLFPKSEEQAKEEVSEIPFAAGRPDWTGMISVYEESVLTEKIAIENVEKIDDINTIIFLGSESPTYTFDPVEKELKLYFLEAVSVENIRPILYRQGNNWLLNISEEYYIVEPKTSAAALKKAE